VETVLGEDGALPTSKTSKVTDVESKTKKKTSTAARKGTFKNGGICEIKHINTPLGVPSSSQKRKMFPIFTSCKQKASRPNPLGSSSSPVRMCGDSPSEVSMFVSPSLTPSLSQVHPLSLSHTHTHTHILSFCFFCTFITLSCHTHEIRSSISHSHVCLVGGCT